MMTQTKHVRMGYIKPIEWAMGIGPVAQLGRASGF